MIPVNIIYEYYDNITYDKVIPRYVVRLYRDMLVRCVYIQTIDEQALVEPSVVHCA